MEPAKHQKPDAEEAWLVTHTRGAQVLRTGKP